METEHGSQGDLPAAPSQNMAQNQNIPKLQGKKGVAIFCLVIVVLAYLAGYQSGHKGYVFSPKDFKVVNQDSLPQTVDYSLLKDAEDIINTKYIDKPVDQQKMLYGAISGAVASLGDPYTVFFPPKNLSDFQTGLKGSFGGIGAEVGSKNGFVVIVAPLDGTPAQKAGLKAKDIITKINATSTENMLVDDAVNLIRGTPGTKVTLTIARPGTDKPFDVTLTRENIVIKSVKWDYKDVTVSGQKRQVAVITISQFGDDTKALFDQAVNDVLKHNVAGIVIDLRNNPGGYLQTAVDVASNWISLGTTVVTEAHSDGTSQVYKAEGNNRLTGIKTEVLINGGSASAAEILSGALHDYKIAELIGEKSFGKGSVQELINLKDGSGIKVTVAKWITPGGVNLNHNGLDPDVKATLTDDDVKNGKDPQMDAALNEITK